jgi:hypothetical protein
MISVQKRFVFIHIPKTGGNSIQSVLRRYSEDTVVHRRDHQDGVERFAVRNESYGTIKHSPLAAYRKGLGSKKFSAFYKFTCVRNPWDRMVSYYFTPGRQKAWDPIAFRSVILEAGSVEDYLRLADEADPFSNVDRILRFENLEQDFRALCSNLDIPPAPLPIYNRSEREHYSKYYDEALRELVSERFAAEIRRFGYTFEMVNAL